MFFAIGVSDKEEKLEYDEGLILCDVCGNYGRYEVYLVCSVFYLFFFPVYRWNYRYYVRTTCCNSVYELDPEVGEAIEEGERVLIRQRDLHLLNKGRSYKKCSYCGYETSQDFDFCPKCGNKF